MADLTRVGAQLVVEGADQSAANWEKNTQAALSYAEVLRQLVPLQAEQAIATIQQAESSASYTRFWETALDKQASDFSAFNAEFDRFQQQEVESVRNASVEIEQELNQRLEQIQEKIRANQGGTVSGEGFTMRDPEHDRAMRDAIRIQEEYFAAQEQSAQESVKVTELSDKEFAAKERLWAANERLYQGLKEQQATQVALQRQNEEELKSITARAQAIVEAGVAFGASTNEMSASLQKLGFSAKEAQAILGNYGIEAQKVSQTHTRLSESAISSSRAFFALTLASFGLMSITQELKKAFGEDLPPAFERFTSFAQQVASFGSAGAFIGGVPGAIIGGISGAVLALGTAAVQVDPQIQQLNQSLNNMSKKDEVIETLSKISGASKDVATEWEAAARKSPEFAKELENLVKKAEPIPPLLKAFNQAGLELTGTLDGLNGVAGKTGEVLNFFASGVVAGTTGVVKFGQELLAGKNVVDAFNSAAEASQRVMQKGLEATASAGIAQEDQNRLTEEAKAILADATKEADKLADAQQRLSDAIGNANFSLAQLAERTSNQYAQAQQQYNNAVMDAADQRNNSILQAEQTLSNRTVDLWQDLQDKVVDVNQSLADKVFDINVQLQNKLAELQQSYQNRVDDIAQKLADQIANIQQDLANKLAELDHRRLTGILQANDKIADAARDLSRKLWEIERDRIEAIERLAYDTHNRLADARTEHDRERILRDSQFELGQIDQKANDARNDAQNAFADKVRQAEREKQLARDTYEYEVMLAKRLAAQKIAEAQHSAEVELAQAQRQLQQQTALAVLQAQQHLQVAERENQQALAQAQRRYNEELAIAQRNFNQQIEAARRAEAQRTADAQRSLEQRNAQIAASYELERQQIQHTLDAAVRAYQRQISEIMNLVAAVRVLLQNYLMLAGVIESIAKIGAAVTTNLFDDWINNMQKLGGLGLQPGGTSNTVPTVPVIPMFGTSGTIHLPSTTSNTSNRNMTIIIQDATDPKKVGEAVRRELEGAGWR